ncbi:guanylate kinase, partial [bacterium]|nr:guanylate kinase [bacterium]
LDRRGSETPEQIETRMARAIEEMELAGMYDFVITNDDVVRATDELVAIIDSYAGSADRRNPVPDSEKD